ncbi:hypothetical protein [Bacillus cereus group sp. BfR-BA-01356]|uniref:hypothetical protein n=1 Tax=Bacillus cereus group sp. BfR-BA-01356 TaxID=2920319 RepID=UPI001F5A7F2F
MTEHIFKRFTPLKKDIFDLVINEMLRVGWKQLNANKENEKDIYMMYSDGNDGKKNIFIEFSPYDGRDVENRSDKSNYDIRKTLYSDSFFRFCTGYDSSKGRGISEDYQYPVSWYNGRRSYSGVSAGDGPQVDPLLTIELYTFIDKEKIIICTIPPSSLSSYPVVSYVGVLEDLMLEELHEPYTRALTWYSSAFSSASESNTGLTFSRPKNSNWTQKVAAYRSIWLSIPIPRNPNIDNNFIMLPFYISHKDYGVRGKLGGIYSTADIGIVSGDILEVEVNEKVQKFKYVNAKSSYGSLPAPLAFRIE